MCTAHQIHEHTRNLHHRVEVIGFLIKAVMAMMCVFVTNWKWLSVLLGVCGLALTVLYVRWVPHMHDWTNHVRVGTFTCVTYCAICLVFLRCADAAFADLPCSVRSIPLPFPTLCPS